MYLHSLFEDQTCEIYALQLGVSLDHTIQTFLKLREPSTTLLNVTRVFENLDQNFSDLLFSDYLSLSASIHQYLLNLTEILLKIKKY